MTTTRRSIPPDDATASATPAGTTPQSPPAPSPRPSPPAAPAPATASARVYPSLRAAWLPMLALSLAFFVEMVDNTLLSIALPTISRDLGSGTTAMQWITGAYSLTFGGFLLTSGSAADRLGRRRVLLVGLAVFGLLSLLVAFVETAGELIALRAALGIAAAAMAPITNSLVFRLFDDQAVRMRAITVMMIVGMSGFVLGPLLGGTALAHVRWEWLLMVNAPIALIAFIGVRRGVAPDRPEDLTTEKLDLPGSLLSIAAIGLGCFMLTSGVQYGWTSPTTLGCLVGCVLAIVLFILRERTVDSPMLDLRLLATGTVRGAALAQIGTSIAMAGVMFALVMHFQFAYGWSPTLAGLANLPMILTMLVSSPLVERLVARYGHRAACLVGSASVFAALAGMAWSVDHGYLPIAISMVVMSFGLRIVMTTCAVALIGGMPENRTSVGAALNDTAQEVGTSIGTAVVGTLIAALVTIELPSGTWSNALVASFFHGERIAFVILALTVGIITAFGALTLTSSHQTDDHPA